MIVPTFVYRYRYTLLASIIGLLFLVPLLLKVHNRYWEPFPALILPGSGSVISNEIDAYRHPLVQLSGIDLRSGELRPLDLALLLDPVPSRYFGPMIRRGIFAQATIDGSAELSEWLQHKLLEQGCEPTPIIVRELLLRYNRRLDGMDEVETTNEYRIELH
ncbi:hypothetical protein GGR28_002494 [Lewinella aquimaris]|uniref:Uncharacterized protein n=1 Tax=Neolewinella aquimaris TaxID=1835722 RepID=A0A840E962_9BACT|nr:hypothetical protein [Neolewinella aquimaris]MBB4079867.1 hypothetical protein [Neolewinella aquimaris]